MGEHDRSTERTDGSSRNLTARVVENYTASSQFPATLEDISTILYRHNLPWLDTLSAEKVGECDSPIESTKDRVTIPDHTAFTKYLRRVDCVPFLYRMHFLKQLSTVTITSHLGATHTRFSHSIGATRVAARMLDWIKREGFHEDARNLSDLDIRACLFYCLIHDAFHGPFGHTLDLMKDVFEAKPIEKLDTHYLEQTLNSILRGEPDPIGEQLIAAANLCTNGNGAGLIKRVAEIADPVELNDKSPSLFFLREIVDSVLDADRIDYLIRDAYYLEGQDYRSTFEDLVASARAVPYGDQVRLAFGLRQRSAASTALGLRRRFYTQYYETPHKLVVDDMLCHAIYYILRDKGLIRSGGNEQQLRSGILRNLLLLTDEDFLAVLAELRATPEAYRLLTRFRQRRFFTPVYTQGIRLDQFESVTEGVKQWVRAIDDLIANLAKQRRANWYPEVAQEKDAAAIQAVSSAFLDDPHIPVYAFQFWIRNSFLARHVFEKGVWERLLAKPDLERSLNRFARAEYGSIDAYNTGEFRQYPPIHVTTSSFFTFLSKEDLVHHAKEGSQPVEDLLMYDEESQRVSPAAIVPEIRENHEAYPLVVSVSPALKREVGQDSIVEAFFAELRSCRWLWGVLRKNPVIGKLPRE